MTRTVNTDYLVVGAGAIGMAFTDALIDHADRARVAMVDRRHGAGGHWLEAYPFVRLHQASLFYGVASTPLGDGIVQHCGPETGLYERASKFEVCAYYESILNNRFLESDRVEFFSACEYLGDRTFVSLVSGEQFEAPSAAGLSMRTILLRAFLRRPAHRSKSMTRLESSRSMTWLVSGTQPTNTWLSVPGRPRRMRASGCFPTGSIQARFVGFGRESRGC